MTNGTFMRIGILQTGHAPDDLRRRLGDYSDMFARLLAGHRFSFLTWDVVDGIFPQGATDADAWLITGSRHGVYDALPWIEPLENLIREIYADGRPLVGVCFGHQIIAQALGGHVEKFSGGWSVGRTVYDFGGRDVALNAWHQDQVITPPDGAETIASTEFCRHAALAYGRKVLTLQPHPEFGADMIAGLIETRGGAVPAERLEHATDNLPLPTQNAALGDQIAAFLKRSADT